jgi:Ca-activated chloride channel family protein
MSLAHAETVNLLWLLPVAVLALLLLDRRKRRALERFAHSRSLAGLAGEELKARRFAKRVLLLTSAALLVFALAGPRWGTRYEEVRRKSADIVLLVDVSSSMLVEDVKPSRLEQVKREVLDLLRVLPGDRVGLVTFAGAPLLLCPLTLDYGALEMFVHEPTSDLPAIPGTDLAAAIDLALSSFDFTARGERFMVLLSDGEDNEGRGREAARKAAAKGVKILACGVGEPSGGPVPSSTGTGPFEMDGRGNPVISKLDEENLRAIAAATGGAYVRSRPGRPALEALYRQEVRSGMDLEVLRSGRTRVPEERFAVFVLAAIALLGLEGLLGERGAGRRADGHAGR